MTHNIPQTERSVPVLDNDIRTDTEKATACYNTQPHQSTSNQANSGGNTTGCWSGYEYPDGSVSIGRVPPEKKGRREKDYDQDLKGKYEFAEWSESNPASYLGWEDHAARRLKEEKIAEFEASLPKLDPPQELSQEKKRYGQNGITPEGKRKVKAAATLLERKYGNKNLTFGTITLPSEDGGLHLGHLYYICENWSSFFKRLLQEIKRELERQGAPTELIAVTEFQEKRYHRLGEPAPHIHFVCVGKPPKGDYYLHPDRLRRVVKRRLEVMLEDEGIEVNANNTVNLQRVKKSAANYLSKYMSKGGEILEQLKEDGLENCIPNQWWSPVGGMREWLKKNIRKVSSEVADFLITANNGDDGIVDRKQIAIEIEEGYELVVGIWLKLSRKMYEMISGIPWDSPIY